MHEVLRSKNTKPIPKICKNLFDFEKPQKLGYERWKMHEKERLGPLPSKERLDLGRKAFGKEV